MSAIVARAEVRSKRSTVTLVKEELFIEMMEKALNTHIDSAYAKLADENNIVTSLRDFGDEAT